MAHTPGPWGWLDGDDIYVETLASPSGMPVLQIADSHTQVICIVPDEPDARLIAAAPELLEMLEKCLPAMEWLYDDFEGVAYAEEEQKRRMETIKNCYALIARVKGE